MAAVCDLAAVLPNDLRDTARAEDTCDPNDHHVYVVDHNEVAGTVCDVSKGLVTLQ